MKLVGRCLTLVCRAKTYSNSCSSLDCVQWGRMKSQVRWRLLPAQHVAVSWLPYAVRFAHGLAHCLPFGWTNPRSRHWKSSSLHVSCLRTSYRQHTTATEQATSYCRYCSVTRRASGILSRVASATS